VRVIQSGHRGVRGFVTVMRREIRFESGLESDFLQILACDPNLTGASEQPVRIDHRGPDGEAAHYTPDFLATYGGERPSAVLYEIKYLADLRREWKALKPAFLAARRHASERGMRFSIMTDTQIRGPYLANMRFLKDYRDRAPDPVMDEHLVRTIAILGETTPHDVVAAAYWDKHNQLAAIAALWRLLSTGRIRADLFERLTMRTPMWVITGEGHQ
jgi:hypothetical protein